MGRGNKNGHGLILDKMNQWFRTRRSKQLREIILSLVKNKKGNDFHILDLGGTYKYWENVGFDFLEENNIRITCVNYVEGEFTFGQQNPRINAIVGDACNLSQFEDNSFNLVHSNSVIEHVGSFENMQRFSGELRRLAPAYYLQTPYSWFPIDPHYPRVPLFHMMPRSIQSKLLSNFKVGWGNATRDLAHSMRILEGTRLLDRSELRYLLPDANLTFEWFFLPKSLIATRIPQNGAA